MTMSISDKERGIQKALGNEKEFRVTVEVPISGIVYITQDVCAVTKEDAEEQTLKMLDIKTDNQLKRDFLPKSNVGLRPFNDESSGFGGTGHTGIRDVVLDRTAQVVAYVSDLTPKTAMNEGSDMSFTESPSSPQMGS